MSFTYIISHKTPRLAHTPYKVTVRPNVARQQGVAKAKQTSIAALVKVDTEG